MNDATIEDVTGLLGYIEGHVQHARDALVKRDRAGALQQLEEIKGWTEAAVEALASDPPASLIANDKTDPLHPSNYTGRSDFAGIESAGGEHVDFDNDDRFDDPAGDHDS